MMLVACICLVLALVPCLLFLQNIRLYRKPGVAESIDPTSVGVSVLIPARNEERNIGEAIESIRNNRHIQWELLVLDDHSEDQTAEIVRQVEATEPRVRLLEGPALPEGWNGKQHVCAVLASHARFPILVFMDADVRLAPDALSRMAIFLENNRVALASGIPRQLTEGFLEKLLVPLIHFVLLGFLPLKRMRASQEPAYGAGCGQLFVASAKAYQQMGGHAAIRASRHDGVKLPRAFREAGFSTDLFDATPLASCRMYHNASEVWNGFLKNAHEGLGATRLIVPASLLLVGGQVLPWLLIGFSSSSWVTFIASLALLAGWLPRWISVLRFEQPILGAALHPLGIIMLVLIQWASLLRRLRGKTTPWKGRSDSSSALRKPLQQAL